MTYKNEQPLFVIALIVSLIFWLCLVLGTAGIALLYGLFFYIAYLFAQSGFISYIKGTGVKVSANQYPDLYERLMACCRKIGLTTSPDCYVLRTGFFNALATKFRGKHFIVLFSDVIDALHNDPEGFNFYIGHELGHIHRKHLTWGVWLAPARILPLLGAAYSRACEYTCDRYGLACCQSPAAAQRGLLAIATGDTRFTSTDIDAYIGQRDETNGFWMSFHELIGTYPWLVKRAAALKSLAEGHAPEQPRRNPLAWLFALFVPNAGGGGSAAAFLIVIAIIGILAAVAVPAFTQYRQRALMGALMEQQEAFQDEAADQEAQLEEGAAADLDEQAQEEQASEEQAVEGEAADSEPLMAAAIGVLTIQGAVETFHERHSRLPATLDELGEALPGRGQSDVYGLVMQADHSLLMVFNADPLRGKSLRMVPSLEDQTVIWQCLSDDLEEEEVAALCDFE
jgi:Zn-dependent protease with chaperone function/Tfp pilus assembly major pilin PilA